MALLTEEQGMLRDAARDWTRGQSPVAAFRKVRDDGLEFGFDPEAWKQMADLGWAAILVPEEYGGVDLGMLTMGLVLEEMGRTLTASPLLASGVGAISALVLGGTEAQKTDWLPQIATGSITGTLAVDEGARHTPEKIALAATPSGDGWLLNGTKTAVIEGMAADLLIVAASARGATELFLVPTPSAGVERKALSLIDSRGVATITFKDVKVASAAKLEGGAALLDQVLDRLRAALCAEMLGMANEAFDVTVEYLKTRVQFGRVIGSFQALQHRAAQMLQDLELSRSAAEGALTGIDEDADDVAELVSIAKSKVGDTLHLITNEMVQMHGGIGMTDDHDAGFYLKRARTAAALYGNQAWHRDRFGRLRGY